MPNDPNDPNDTPQTIVTESGGDCIDDDGNDIRQDFEFRYKIIGKIASGGMGTILEAEHVILRKRVALKVLNKALAGDRLSIARFEREAQACAALVHPNMVQVYDCGLTPEGTPYLVMDFVPGKNILDILKEKGPLEPSMFFDVFIQVADALQYAHSQGVIHRDLKPGNIILTPGPRGTEVPILVDFGIAKVEEMGGQLQLLTQTGELLGSPSYMSPEQCKGEKVDGRTDIYALGCLMYEALTGKKAFRGQTAMALIQEHLRATAIPPRDLESKSDFQVALSDMIMKCIEKEPDKRFQTMRELQDDLISKRKNLVGETKKKSSLLSKRNIIALSAVSIMLLGIAVMVAMKDLTKNSESQTESQVPISKTGFAGSLKGPSPLVFLSRSITFQDEDIPRWEESLEEAWSTADERNLPALDKIAIAHAMLDTYAPYWNEAKVDEVFKRIEPSLNKVKNQFARSAKTGKYSFTGSAPLIYCYVAESKEHQGKHEDSIKMCNEGLSLLTGQPDEQWFRAKLERQLGMIYLKMEKLDDAAKLISKSGRAFTALYGQNSVQGALALKDMAAVYKAENHIDKAKESLREAIKILEKTVNAFQLRECQNELLKLESPK